jgi:hypothetical protein
MNVLRARVCVRACDMLHHAQACSCYSSALRQASVEALRSRQLDMGIRIAVLSDRAEAQLRLGRWEGARADAAEAMALIDPAAPVSNPAVKEEERGDTVPGTDQRSILADLIQQADAQLITKMMASAKPLVTKGGGSDDGGAVRTGVAPDTAAGSGSGVGYGSFHQHLAIGARVTVLVPGLGKAPGAGKQGRLVSRNEGDGTWCVCGSGVLCGLPTSIYLGVLALRFPRPPRDARARDATILEGPIINDIHIYLFMILQTDVVLGV